MYYGYYDNGLDETIDLFYLKKLPQFSGMSENEIRQLFTRILNLEQKQWEAESIAKRFVERVNDQAYLEVHRKDYTLPREEVKIQQGVFICPSLVDDKGFISCENLSRLKRVMKLYLDDKRKIYI